MADAVSPALLDVRGLVFLRDEQPVFGPLDLRVDAGEALLEDPEAAIAALLEGLLVRRITGRTKPADLLELLLTPFLPLLALPVFQRASRKEVEWKGRKYAQDRRL